MTLPIRRRSNEEFERDNIWNPLEQLQSLHHDLSALLDEWRPLSSLNGFRPVADVEERDDAYFVEIELAGVKPDDVDIEVSGRRLVVSGERKERERVGILRTRERTIGRFHYEVTLPSDIDESEVDAHLDEGILSVRLPRPERDRPRRVEIST